MLLPVEDTSRVLIIELAEVHRCLVDQEQQIRPRVLVPACLDSEEVDGVACSGARTHRMRLPRRIKSMLRLEEVSACRDPVLLQLRLLRHLALPELRSTSSVHSSTGIQVEGS